MRALSGLSSQRLAGTRQHHIQAALLGRFSEAPAARARESVVWVRRRASEVAFSTRAEKVGYARELYTLTDNRDGRFGAVPETFVDESWGKVERRLPAALDELSGATEGLLRASTFAEVLVPFAASLFVRAPEYDARRAGRLRRVFGPASERPLGLRDIENSRTQVNLSRVFELQRLFAPVMRADWALLKVKAGAPSLVTNDLGYALWTPNQEPAAIIVPVSPEDALFLRPSLIGQRLCVAVGNDGWHVELAFGLLDADAVLSINESIAAFAHSFLVGASREAVDLPAFPNLLASLPDGFWGPGPVLRFFEHDLLNFLVEVAQGPDEKLSWEEAITRIEYPIPVHYVNAGDDIGLEPEERAELVALENEARAAKHREFRERFGAREIVRRPR